MRNRYKFCTELQYMGKRQVANVGVLLTVNKKITLMNNSESNQSYSNQASS